MASPSSVTAASATAAAAGTGTGTDLLTGHAGREAMRVDADTVLVLIDAESLFHGATANDARCAAVQANVQQLQRVWAEREWPILGVSGGVVRTLDGSPPGPSPFPSLVDSDASAFITSNLDYVLRRLQGSSDKPRCFVVAGNGAERAVESTVRDGSDKGYIISVATDAVLGSSPAAEARAQYNLKGFARIRTTEQILSEVAAAALSSSLAVPGACHAGKTALLVIDVQNYCADVGGGGMHDAAHSHEGGAGSFSFARRIQETMVPNIQRLLRRCRALGHEVLFTTIEDLTQDGRDRSFDYKYSAIDVPKGHRHAQVLEAIGPVGDEIRLPKTSASVFMSTTIDYVLQNLGVSSLVVCGMISNQCVESSARDAAGLGYRVTMVSDATTAHTQDDQVAAEEAIRRLGLVMTTEEALTSPDSPLAPPPHARILRLAVLRAEGCSTYGDCILPSFQQLFRAAAASLQQGANGNEITTPLVVELFDFDVRRGQYPAPEAWGAFDGVLLPGSYSSAYDTDDWVQELKRTIRKLHAREMRMVGVCFGHQIIAESLGGKVISNPKGLTVGRREFELCGPAPQPALSSLYYYHGDIVEQPPPGATILGVDERCPNHGMQIGTHVLTVQGHPEFAPCAPAGHDALKTILVEKGMQDMEWGKAQETESLLWATRFLQHFCSD